MRAKSAGRYILGVLAAAASVLAACEKKQAPRPVESSAPPASSAPAAGYVRIDRLVFNRRVVELDLPLFWRND
ncbi:MAG TPA: hypothetical protein VF103_16745, partial [Polyangiaceae bacterium]